MIGRILLHIREACEEAKQTPLPTEILVILYGFGNPAIGCHMDCTKDFLDPDAILTPSMILNELPPDRDATLAMRMFAPRPWVESYRLHRHELDKIKIAYPMSTNKPPRMEHWRSRLLPKKASWITGVPRSTKSNSNTVTTSLRSGFDKAPKTQMVPQ